MDSKQVISIGKYKQPVVSKFFKIFENPKNTRKKLFFIALPKPQTKNIWKANKANIKIIEISKSLCFFSM